MEIGMTREIVRKSQTQITADLQKRMFPEKRTLIGLAVCVKIRILHVIQALIQVSGMLNATNLVQENHVHVVLVEEVALTTNIKHIGLAVVQIPC